MHVTTAYDEQRVRKVGGVWVTPGLADLHSHLGVMSAPSLSTNLSGQSLSFPPRVRD